MCGVGVCHSNARQEYEARELAAQKVKESREQVTEIAGRPANFPPFPSRPPARLAAYCSPRRRGLPDAAQAVLPHEQKRMRVMRVWW